MKNTILLMGAAVLLFAACKPDAPNGQNQAGVHTDTRTLLAGHWIALDFCSRVNQYGSVLDAMTNSHVPYAYAFSFDPNKPDSVICYNGMEEWALPAKFNADTIEVVGARPGKSIFMVYNSQGSKDITVFDGTAGTVQLDSYIKSKANARDGFTAFVTALNHNLFNGVLTPLGKGAAKQEVQFTPGGFILNWGAYDRFSVCTAGDCFVGGNDIDVITLRKSKVENSETFFGFAYSAQNDTLTLYNLVNTNPEEKGAYKIKNVAYTFLRKAAEQ